MKTIYLCCLLGTLAGCTTPPKVAVSLRPLSPPVAESLDALRYGEVVRSYAVGRYIDPNHAEMMHEHHSLYRVEASARWNLHPDLTHSVGVGLLNPPRDAAYTLPQTNDVILVELSRQKQATERVMWEAFQLAEMYDQVKKVLEQMVEVAKNQAWVKARLANNERRVSEVSKGLENLSQSIHPPLQPDAKPTEIHSDP